MMLVGGHDPAALSDLMSESDAFDFARSWLREAGFSFFTA